MPTSALRRWLRRLPHPTTLRVDGRGVAVASGPRMWIETEESVLAMNPRTIEAIGPKGVVLRVTTLRDDEEATGEEVNGAKAGETEIATLARLICEAHDAGARRHAEAYSLAFSENTKLVQILAARLGGLEQAWQEAMQQTAQARADALVAAVDNESEDPAGSAVATMLATAMMNAPKAKANGATNGAKEKKGAS